METPTLIMLNGAPYGYFKSKRRTRQGDPRCLYLFVMILKLFAQIMRQSIDDGPFKSHFKCKKPTITRLPFADDLIASLYGDIGTSQFVKNNLATFNRCSGLEVNVEKSNLVYAAIDDTTCDAIQRVVNFDKGVLPVKYLGLPLTSARLYLNDSIPLIDKVANKLRSWVGNFCSYAG